MELTADQEAKFRDLCREIKPGGYGKVIVNFIGSPTNLVQITGEKNFRFHDREPEPTHGEAQDRHGSGRMG